MHQHSALFWDLQVDDVKGNSVKSLVLVFFCSRHNQSIHTIHFKPSQNPNYSSVNHKKQTNNNQLCLDPENLLE